MGLNQPNLHHSPDVVAVSVHPAFTARTKLEQFGKCVLRSWSRIPNWILKVVWRRVWRSVRRRRVQFAIARIVVLGGASVILYSWTRVEIVSCAVRLADRE